MGWQEHAPDKFEHQEDDILNQSRIDPATTDRYRQSQHFDRRYIYFLFRMGGMGYGPGFRLLRTVYRKGDAGPNATGHTTLSIKEDHDEWEEFTGYHAGIYDCALQTGMAKAQGNKTG